MRKVPCVAKANPITHMLMPGGSNAPERQIGVKHLLESFESSLHGVRHAWLIDRTLSHDGL